MANHLRTLATALALASTVSLSVARGAAPEPPPLSDPEREVLFGSPEDLPPKVLNAKLKEAEGRHYLKGDEWNIHLFYPHIKDLGGGFMGVGTDQCYFFIGWMKPQLAWITDYDTWVLALHRAYKQFFLSADSPDAFRQLWSKKNLDASLELLEKAYADDSGLALILKVFKKARPWVAGRLRRMMWKLDKLKIPSFINDQATYDFVRGMLRSARIRPLLANLLAEKGVKGVAAAARQLKVPIRAIYLSNAEQYWPYPQQFRDNMLAIPDDDRSIVLRTTVAKVMNNDYRYHIQRVSNFKEWLKRPWAKRVEQMVERPWIRNENHVPLTITNWDPDQRRAEVLAKRKAKQRKQNQKR